MKVVHVSQLLQRSELPAADQMIVPIYQANCYGTPQMPLYQCSIDQLAEVIVKAVRQKDQAITINGHESGITFTITQREE